MTIKTISPSKLQTLRGKRSREWVAHELRKRGFGTDAKTIWRWERGHNAPNGRILSDYAAVLGRSVEDLYGDGDDADGAGEDDDEADPVEDLKRAFAAFLDQVRRESGGQNHDRSRERVRG